ncbi:hypothetical protein [uncultured Hoeflea sp.]|uniref:hypothetical protein n=1 Tax=uncultured Hoeflea sp. TaxID=538666 RepID=UPI00260DCE22|nr:hypothetical protein [uncultured Hoeflea sp.]
MPIKGSFGPEAPLRQNSSIISNGRVADLRRKANNPAIEREADLRFEDFLYNNGGFLALVSHGSDLGQRSLPRPTRDAHTSLVVPGERPKNRLGLGSTADFLNAETR